MTAEATMLRSTQLDILPQSVVVEARIEYGMVRKESGEMLLAVASPHRGADLGEFHGSCSESGQGEILVGPLDGHNAGVIRRRLKSLQPMLLGLSTSAGMGDRLGLGTAGHVRAVRACGSRIRPIFAQQSIREMSRTGRSPGQVMDDATWGMLSEGWTGGAGADADHLKTTGDIDACLNAGFTFFTIDPGAHVENRAPGASLGELRQMAEELPAHLSPSASGLQGKTFDIERLSVVFDEEVLLRSAVKYGKAVSHVASMFNHLQQTAGSRPFELEVSVDETDQPTSHAEHIYIACELKRLGVKWVSLAPRYIGRFEKGVDYIGDLDAFQRDFSGHAAIARALGPYKLSLHSGSDKFSIYPIAQHETRGLVHLKTAGTSYLEALRTIAELDPVLFREIYIFARQRYETDRVSYHVSAELDRAPLPEEVKKWPGLLDQFDAREILHVTFGSVLTSQSADGTPVFHDRLKRLLRNHPEAYASNLEKHFIRHLQPFTEN